MKKISILTAVLVGLLCFLGNKASAQYYFYNDSYYDNPFIFELGGSAGMMNCLTDLGGKKGIGKKFIKDVNLGNSQFAGSVFLSATFKNAVAIRLEGTFGQIKAFDSILSSSKSSVYGRYERNLSFRSTISEISLVTEIHPIYIFGNWEGRDQEPPRFSPYLLAGIGYFSFNPQAKLGNNYVDLQPLSTEGQGFKEYPNSKPYKLKQVNFPLGLGLRYELSPLFNVRAEFNYRLLTTDYLDDVSSKAFIDPSVYSNYFTGTKLTNALLLNDRHYELNPAYVHTYEERGNPSKKDGYFSINVKASIIFGRERVKK
jgi:hypothetical protein